ncbi:MAG: hypothetical protein WAK26_19285 [Terracidiphilus sp.]|jgi:hypothetical protein
MDLKEGLGSEKPPTAFAVGGLENARLLNPVRQAPLPACALDLVIRGLGIDKAMLATGEKRALGGEMRMTLIAVEQTGKGSVKKGARGIGQP